MSERYEYKTVKAKQRSERDLARILNKHGKDGWELVKVGAPKWAHTKVDVLLRRAV